MDQNTPLGGIDIERLYTTAEAALILDLHPDTVYRIPEAALRRTRVGPRYGRTRIAGQDLLDYLQRKAA